MAQRLNKKESEAKDFLEMAFASHNKDNEWYSTSDRLLKAYKGKYYKRKANRTRFTLNTIYSIVNIVMPSLIFQKPWIPVKAKSARLLTPESNKLEVIKGRNLVRRARNMEASLNNQYEKIGAIFEDQLAVQDALFFSYGLTKDGYSFDTMSKKDEDYVTKGSTFHRRVDPRDFGRHPMATGVDDAPKLVHRLWMLKSEVKKILKELGESTSKIDKVNTSFPDHIKERFSKLRGSNGHEKSVAKDYVVVYEIHDQENGEILIYAGDEDPVLLHKKKDPYHFNGSHFNMIKFAGVTGEFEGIAPMAMVEDECHVLNEVLTLMVGHYRKFTGQVFMNKGIMDADDMDRFESGEQGSIFEVGDINKILRTHPLAMGNDYFNIITVMNNLVDRVLGIGDFNRIQGGRRSASEASFIEGNATVRRNYMLKFVKDFVLSGVQKQAGLLQQFMDEKQMIQSGGELQYEFFEVTKEDIQGEFMYDFDVDNMTAVNETQMQQIVNTLQVLAGNEVLHPVLKQLDPYKTGRVIFKKSGLVYEDFTTDFDDEVIFHSPDKEHRMAEKGEQPRAKTGEKHKEHIEAHTAFIRKRISELGPERGQEDPAVNRMIEHVAEHQMKDQEELGVQATPPPPNLPGPNPQGPQGPLEQGPVGPVPVAG